MAIGKGNGPDACAGPDTSVGSEAGKGADPDMRNGANANARLAARDDALGKGTGADSRLAASDATTGKGAGAAPRLAASDDAMGKGTGADPRLAASDEPLVRVPIAYRDPPERPILRDMGGGLLVEENSEVHVAIGRQRIVLRDTRFFDGRGKGKTGKGKQNVLADVSDMDCNGERFNVGRRLQ